MNYLLDHLHDNFNTIQKKPYLESKDFNPQKETEDEYFYGYKNYLRSRENSVITDFFQGITRTSLQCTTCQNVNFNFQEFYMLSLTLPETNEKENIGHFTVYFQSWDSIYHLTKFVIFAPEKRETTLTQLKKFLAMKLNIREHTCHFYLFDSSRNSLEAISNEESSMGSFPEDFLVLVQDHPFISNPDQAPSQPQVSPKDEEPQMEVTEKKQPSIFETKPKFDQDEYCLVNIRVAEKKLQDTRGMYKVAYLKRITSGKELLHFAYSIVARAWTFSYNTRFYDFEEIVVSNPDEMFYFQLVRGDASVPLFFDIDSIHEICPGDSLELHIPRYSLNRLETLCELKLGNRREKYFDERDSISIYSCLQNYVALDFIDERKCSVCKENRKCSKSESIQEASRYLVIHLSRLKRDNQDQVYKDDRPVRFPIENLDISPYLTKKVHETEGMGSMLENQEPLVYDLVTYSNHYGDDQGGHFTAYVRTQRKDEWYLLDDDNVSITRESELNQNNAYILFYRRR